MELASLEKLRSQESDQAPSVFSEGVFFISSRVWCHFLTSFKRILISNKEISLANIYLVTIKVWQAKLVTLPQQALIKRLFLFLFLSALSVSIWLIWEPMTKLLSDPSGQALQIWVEEMGIWGPLGLIFLNIMQVLVAPLPGYPIIFVCGVLFGGFWGAIYANLGIILSGLIAMMLARLYGRPLVTRFVEETSLQRFERVLESNSVWLWFLILFLPTGDLPYFVAGLSRVSIRNYLIALCAARLPFTFVITYAAAEAVSLPTQTILWLSGVILFVMAFAYWQQERLASWVDYLLEHLPKR